MAALADILAKMRKVADSHASIGPSALRVYADRIEEEVKRELAKVEADALSAGGLVEAMRHKRASNWRGSEMTAEPLKELHRKQNAAFLKGLYRKQSAALASTARKMADMDPRGKFSSLDVHNYSGNAPVVIQTFATCPGTDLKGER